MAGIEFLDTDSEQPARQHATAAATPARWAVERQAQMGTAALWVATAVLGLVAAFRSVWMLSYPSDSSASITMDGWGRAQSVAPDSGQHGPRFAIAISVLVALTLVAAVLGLVQRTATAGRVVGLVAIGGLAGVIASAYFYADSTLDTYRAAILVERLDPSFTASGASSVQLKIGSLIWFGLLAVACAIAALALPAVLGVLHRRRAGVQAELAETAPLDVHPDDETLAAGS